MGLEPRRRTPSILVPNISLLQIISGVAVLKNEANVGGLRSMDVSAAESSPTLSEIPRIASIAGGTLEGATDGATDGKTKAW